MVAVWSNNRSFIYDDEKSYQAFIPAVIAMCVWPLSYQQKSHEYKFLHIKKGCFSTCISICSLNF